MEDLYLKRLSFIKYLYTTGVNQSVQPEPLCATSVLSFHDCVELFLQLCCDKLNVSKSNIPFMDYWAIIDNALSGSQLSQKAGMNRLNKTRVNLKHHGVMPSKNDIEEFRTLMATFLSENTYLIFNIAFDEISLIDMIKFERARECLKSAQAFYHNDKCEDSLTQIACSFAYLTQDFEKSFLEGSPYAGHYLSPFSFGKSMTFLNAFHMGIRREDGKIKNFVDNVSKTITEMQDALKLICFGIDYKKYAKFKMITPHVDFAYNGEPICSLRQDMTLNQESFDFCQNFIIECSLKLQEFDFNIG